MTRALVQQMLEALEESRDDVAECLDGVGHGAGRERYDNLIAHYIEQLKKHDAAITAARAYLEAPDEPVAYSYTSRITGAQGFSHHPLPRYVDPESWEIKPLYTHPAPEAKQEPVVDSAKVIEELHKANQQLGWENEELQDRIKVMQKKNPPLAYYDISHDEDGEVEYLFSVYPRKDYKPLYAHPTPQPEPVNQRLLEALTRIAHWGGTTKFHGNGSYTDVARAAIAAAEQQIKEQQHGSR